MINVLETDAERRAEVAESLPAFSGLKLLHVKKQLEILLGLIGRNEVFDEYTRHDVSHIDAMLRSLDWLIPESSKAIMTPADWLVAVLGIYFHDLGMLVTRKEYDGRRLSGFDAFVEGTLFAADQGKDYRSRVDLLPSEQRERFLLSRIRSSSPRRADQVVDYGRRTKPPRGQPRGNARGRQASAEPRSTVPA
jgi:hypothetical protein